jgi:hypothetical protein
MPGDFFLGTLDCAGVDDPGTRNPCRENGWLSYDTLSGYSVATNRGGGSFKPPSPGVTVRKSGNYWIKKVDPNANEFFNG